MNKDSRISIMPGRATEGRRIALLAILGGGLAVALVGPLAGAGARAQSDEPVRREVSLTVYNNDLGLVRDVREIVVPEELGWVQFREVPALIDPTSVHLEAVDGRPLEVVEQNFRYDLVSPDRILERYLDSEIQVVLEDERLFEGHLLSAQGNTLVLGGAAPGAGVTILSRDKVTDIRFPALPEGLITRPTLAWLLGTPRAGARQVEVSYLTSGFEWHAEYVALVDAEETGLNLSGWVSVANRSGAAYPDADLQLVAGDVRRVSNRPVPMGKGMVMDQEALMARAPGFEEESFFEYHLYTLGRPTTLLDNETKQIALFVPADAKVEKRYEANPRRDAQRVRVVLEMENSSANGLGMPLPQGVVRVYKRDTRERLQFIGEDHIAHTPRDEQVRVFIGHAFDIVAERIERDMRRIGSRVHEVDVEIEVRNRKAEPVTVILQEDLYGFWEILSSSLPYEKKSATQIEFNAPVWAGETLTVAYTVRYTQ
ncbi:MAG: DUF4139 domain-containing protein [Candidatus Eisenbacteria bacterium]